MLKISPTLLERYRLARQGKYGLDGSAVIEYLTGEFVMTWQASRGIAYHEMLEHGPDKYRWTIPENEDPKDQEVKTVYLVPEPRYGQTWEFTEAAAQPAIDAYQEYKHMVHETWAEFDTNACGYEVKIRYKIDGLDGLLAREFKTKGSQPKVSDYMDGIQWKVYLAGMPELQAVKYDIFQLGKKNNWCKRYQFRLDRYPGIERDVQEATEELISWLELQPGMIDRITMAEDLNPFPF